MNLCHTVVLLLLSARDRKPPKAKKDDLSTWRAKGGNSQSTQYSSLTQIDEGNVSNLLAWQYKSGNFPDTEQYGRPVAIAGGLVFIAASRHENSEPLIKRVAQFFGSANYPQRAMQRRRYTRLKGSNLLLLLAAAGNQEQNQEIATWPSLYHK